MKIQATVETVQNIIMTKHVGSGEDLPISLIGHHAESLKCIHLPHSSLSLSA